jgi:hypothetical protein
MNKFIFLAFLLFTSLCWADGRENTIKNFSAPYNLEELVFKKLNHETDESEGDISIEVRVKLNGRTLFRARPADIEIQLVKTFRDDPDYSLNVKTQCEVQQKRNQEPVFKEDCSHHLIALIEDNLQLLAAQKPTPRDTMANTSMPKFYLKRTEPVLNVGLLYYGDHYTEEDLFRVQKLLEERFHLSTNKLLRINTVFKKILPFKSQIQDFPDYRQEYVTDPIRLQRLWYYDNVGMGVVNEVYTQVKDDLGEIDALLLITGAQFEGMGFASGRIAVIENPREIAWGSDTGGRIDYLTDAKVVDELIHELGHTIYLGHASDQCFQQDMEYQAIQECCKQSTARNDVMSYCRHRPSVSESFFYRFEACNIKTIKEKVIPRMLSGGEWRIEDSEKCD